MTKARELLNPEQDVTLSSGVTVHIVPFPTDLMQDINAYALEQFPDPVAPKKAIQTVDGEELVDDINNAEYKSDKDRAEAGRKQIIFNAFLEECVQFDLAPYEPDIQRISKKYKVQFPEELSERKIKFLLKYAVRTTDDFEVIGSTVMRLSGISEERIAQRRETFRPEMARPETNEVETPGPTQE